MPAPATLVGANINGKPNFLIVAWCSCVNNIPPMVSISLKHSRYTRTSIRENDTFSVNVPSTSIVKEMDFCDIFSGKRVDKSKVFNLFY